ncbi:response regulator, partial [Micromonospora chalcea]
MITVAAIDDDRMLLDGLRTWLAPVEDVRLVQVAATVDGYLDRLGGADAPRVVLLDLNLRDGSDPADNVARVRAGGGRVLVVSAVPDADGVLATIGAGAAGYLTKSHPLDVLVEAIREVASGGSAISPELAFVLSRDARADR